MPIVDVYEYTDKLLEILKRENKATDISLEFRKIEDIAGRIKFLQKLFIENNVIVEGKLKLVKSEPLANAARDEGNKLYQKNRHLEALEAYNKSLCFAETGSPTEALAFANRSAVYFELKLHDLSLRNVDLAIEHGYPKDNLHKLEKRKKQCEEMLNNQKQTQGKINEPVAQNFIK